jgi:hydrophobic/amphiphilic exporter-1 (mainly G- bacteria), HAE1 family
MFSEFFINRPIFAAVISIVIVLIGLITIPLLPVEKTPDITPPTVSVSAVYPGANAQTVADTVATPIEEAINGVDNLLYMSSSSSNDGRMQLTATFEVGTDVDTATILVQNRVSIAEGTLPEEVLRQGISTRKQSPNITLVACLISPDGRYDQTYMSNYINLRMKDVLSRVPGVGNINVFGSKDFAMRLWLDPEKLKARNLTTNDVIAAVRAQNVQVTGGQLGSMPSPKQQQFQYTIQTLGRLKAPEQFGNIILRASPNGRILRLKDVARVELGAENYYWNVKLDGRPSVAMGIFQTPGSNALAVAKGVNNALEKLSKDFPEGLEYRIPYNPTTFISVAIEEILITLGFTILLVILTVYFFLGDWRATLIPSITIPVSLIGTFAVMLPLGMSINTLTMFGLILVIGIVVDDAIVVVENTSRIIEEEALPAKEAAVKAMRQVTGPVIATTLVLLAVFIPTVVMGGITGRLYQQFGITISIAVLFSSINALTMSPALCALLLRPRSERSSRFGALIDRIMKTVRGGYISVVAVITRMPFVMMLLFALMIVLAVLIFTSLPTGFIPNEDEGSIFINARLPDGATLDRTERVMDDVSRILKNTNGVQDYVTVSGFSILDGAIIPNGAVSFVNLQPWSKRKTPSLQVSQILNRLQMQFFALPGALILGFAPPAIHGLGRTGGFELQLQDRGGAGIEALETAAQNLMSRAASDPVITRLNSTLRANVPQLFVNIDREKALSLGVPLETIFSTLATNLGSTYVNDFNIFGRVFKVIAQADTHFRSTKENIERLEVRNSQGRMLPLRTVLSVQDIVGPQIVTHFNLYPSTTISGTAQTGYSSGQAISEMEKLGRETLPENISYEWSGGSYQEIRAGHQAPKIFLIAAVFAFLFLAAQYESWTIPFAIVFAVPIALLGAVVFTWARGYENNVYTQIGIVLLIGLASKTAILLVEFAKKHHEAGASIHDAAIEASRLRFRPILMTALSFVFGTVPLVIASGAGANARRDLGTAVFGGMLVATVVGILMIPVFYVVVQKITEKVSGRKV